MAHPFIPVTDTLKVQMVYLVAGQYCENVLHIRHTSGAISLVNQGELAAFMKGWYTDHFKTLQSTDCSLVKIITKDLTSETGLGLEYTTGLPIAGTHASPILPTNVTAAVKFTTGLGGRSYRGRNFIVGMPEDSVSGNTIDAGIITQLTAAYGELISAMLADWEFVVASFYHNNAWRVSGVATPVTGVSCDPYVDSQRRRLTGRGR